MCQALRNNRGRCKKTIYLYVIQFINDCVRAIHDVDSGYTCVFYILSIRMEMLYYIFTKYLPREYKEVNEKIFNDSVFY